MNERMPYEIAIARLQQYPALCEALGDTVWLQKEMSKPLERYGLIAGWLTVSESEWRYFKTWINDLNAGLKVLEAFPSTPLGKIRRKLRTHANRANTKGLLSEIALWVFLAEHQTDFDIERKLRVDSSKDVDVSIITDQAQTLHIEIQWLSESDISQRGSEIARIYGDAYPIDFKAEKLRIKRKIGSKIDKLTVNECTFVALDCTTAPELGGDNRKFSVIQEAVEEIYSCRDNSDAACRIKELVDGVIWFELVAGSRFLPQKRGVVLNYSSPFINSTPVYHFCDLWVNTD